MYNETNAVFLDISKAFDRLIRELIIWKLKYICNISDPIIKWIHEFLNNRKQRVKIWGSTSNWMKTKSGGPQGSVLLPLLFSLYIYDVPVDSQINVSETRGSKFVDDICCYSTGEYHVQIKDLNRRMKDIFDWSNNWGIDFNVSKCRIVTFVKNIYIKKEFDRTIKFGDGVIEIVLVYTYLGITLYHTLNFDIHVDKKIKRCNREIFVLSSIAKKSSYGKRLFSKIFWRTKIRPMLEYGSEIWSCNVSDHKFQEIKDLQIRYIRQTHKFGAKSCKTAMMMDLSFIDIGLRISSLKEKYLIKIQLRLVPRRIVNLYLNRDRIRYPKNVTRDDIFTTGYPHVVEHNGRYKYKSKAKYLELGKNKTKNFYGDYARAVEKDRIWWINRNFQKWYELRKFKHTMFSIDKFSKEQNSRRLIMSEEIQMWKEILEGDVTKLWNLIKMKIKRRTQMVQEKNWNITNEGKVLKQYKKKWICDPIINNVRNPNVHIIKRMRIGNSMLKSHYGQGSSKLCTNCDENVPETNDHYLLECSKFKEQRKTLIKNVEKEMKTLNTGVSVKTMLGYYPEIFSSKCKIKKYKCNIENVLKSVINYVNETNRFNRNMWKT